MNNNTDHYFLKGGGEMGALMRAKDWSTTSLGDPSQWPQSLKTMVAVMLDNPFGMYIAWGNDYIQLYNDGYRPILGSTKHPQALGISTRVTFSEIWDNIIGSMFDGVMKGKAIGFPDFMLPLNRNGFIEECFFDFAYSPIRKDNGEVGGVLVTVIETSNKKKTEEALKESEVRFRTIADDAPVFIFLAGENAEVEYLNKTWRDYTGISTNDSKGRGWADITHIDDIVPATKIYMDGFNKRESCSFENRQKGTDGIYRTILWKATPRFSINGEFIGMMGVGIDIHERKKSEEKLRESEEQFSTLADNMENLAWLADSEGWIYWYNKRWLEYTGLTMEEMLGWGWQKVHHPDHVEQIIEISKKIWHINETFELTFPLRRHDGEFRWFLTRGYPVTNEEGKIIRWIGTNTDIDEQKKAEEQFRVLADQAPMWVWLTDKEVNVLYANPEVLRFIGISHYTEFTGNMWEQKVHQEDITMVYKSFGEAAALQQPFSFEFRVQNVMTNEYEWFYIKGVPRLEAGEFTGFIGTGININQQKLILSQLEYRKTLLEAHNEASLDGILLVDTKGMILSYNHRFVEIWNMPQQIVLDKDDKKALEFALSQLAHPEKFIEKVEWFYNKPDETSIDELEFKDGKVIKRYGYHVAGEDGKYYGCSWIFRDITDQRMNERAIKESEERFRSLAQTLPQLVWMTDAEGNAEFASSRWKDYTGIETDGEKAWKSIVHPEDYDGITTAWIHSVSTGTVYKADVRLKNKEGEYRWHTVIGEPVLNSENKIVKWVGAFTDIQEQKIREEKKDEFLSIASHEMKTPLTTAKAYLHMLENILNQNNDKASLYAKKAKQSVNRLNELASELLDVSKISFGKLNYTITTFNFNDMIESTIENIQLTSLKHNIIKTGKVNVCVTGDQERLQQVVNNLLTNAIKYSPGAKKVFVNVEYNNESIKVSVKDLGIGIAQKSLDKIFEKYHRVEEHSVYFQGLGIGLFICYEIIERHHGRLWAESEPGKGSTFYFTIPINGNLAQ